MELTGLHHVTAVTANAKNNVDFYTRVLGLRLVKKTVNQDDVSAYHLFYGDEIGAPGTEVTFFDWPRTGRNHAGAGSISTISLRTNSQSSIDWWATRLAQNGVEFTLFDSPGQRQSLEFQDPEGQYLRIVDGAGGEANTPWPLSPVPADHFLRGLDSVTLTVRRLASTERVLTQVMGMRQARSYTRNGLDVVVFEMGAGGPGREIEVVESSRATLGLVGAGGVHHVAFRTPTAEEQQGWVSRLKEAGIGTSGVVDRFYFRSLYFREPGGILFEIATDGPGFATDEPREHLGEALSLPPFLEPHRTEIEAGLLPLGDV